MPADIIDQAQDLIESRISSALKDQQNITSIPFSGFCLACDEEVGQRRYCDSYCREEHEKSLRRKSTF